MANNLSASFPAYWSKRMQMKHYRTDVFREFCSFEEQSTLTKGTIVHRPYRSNLTVNTMGSEGSFTRQDVTDTDETLTVDTEKEVSFYVKDLDAIQSNYATINMYADDAATALSNGIDGDILGEVANALNTIDDADFGGTSGNGITLTESNVFDVFLMANEKLDRRNAPQEGRIAAVSPQFLRVLKSALVKRESPWGDMVGQRGFMGVYDNFSVYKSNGIYWTGVLALATQPTDGDTVTLNIPDSQGTRTTVTFTFKTTLGSTPGNVLIGASADAARSNLAALINTPGTTTSLGVALSAANQALLKGVTATDASGPNTMTVAAKGKGFLVVGETLTDATDAWTAATQLQHQLFAVKGSIDLVIQVQPNLKIKSRDGYVGDDLVSWNVYGKKTFAEGARNMVAVKIRADQFLAS